MIVPPYVQIHDHKSIFYGNPMNSKQETPEKSHNSKKLKHQHIHELSTIDLEKRFKKWSPNVNTWEPTSTNNQ